VIVSRHINDYLIYEGDSVEAALRKISQNKKRCVIVVSADGRLVGTFTDGDFRRWLVEQTDPSLNDVCGAASNPHCTVITESSLGGVGLDKLFNDGIQLIPIVDSVGHVVAVGEPRGRDFSILDHRISQKSPVFVIAEIGINHNGDVVTAKRLVDAAAAAGADCAKFQLRDLDALYRNRGGATEGEDLGTQYTLDLLKECSLSSPDLIAVLDYVTECGMVPLCTPWDQSSAQVLSDYGLPAYKIASADLTNHPLLEQVASYGVPLIVSTGMSTEEEISEAVAVLMQSHSSFALLQCSSSYPAPFKDLNLAYMQRLGDIGNCHVGYSGHERGHHIPLAAVALGARIIEKHITLDKTARGNDHRVSLEPDEFGQMVRQIRDVEQSMGDGGARRITQGESLNRLSLGKSLVATKALSRGHVVGADDVVIKSPGRGLQPNSLHLLLGRSLARDVAEGDFFYPADIKETIPAAREFSFDRKWGLPVRFHDWRELANQSNPDFLEFHLSYRDLEVDVDTALDPVMPYGLVVHSPDLFEGDLILDLASADEGVRCASVIQLQRVVDLTRRLVPRFRKSTSPFIVASLGGSTLEAPASASEKARMMERVLESIGELDLEGVELLAQTLPPFPWYLGGQRHCNLFVDPHETAEFSRTSRVRLCFDVAHTKLACNHGHRSFSDAARTLLPYSAHLHLVDAGGLDDEGLQILEGEVDWLGLSLLINELAPDASFIPEIWQGHVDSGRGFWIALDRLEAFSL
jgi:sialic acid synthase SpsE/sugar phosphate isomerase/epimerase